MFSMGRKLNLNMGKRQFFDFCSHRCSYDSAYCRNSSVALAEINQLRSDDVKIQAAVASKTDEPGWAKFCMDNLVVEDGTTLSKCFGSRVEISFENKKHHLKRLRKATGIPFEQMVFFDNEYGNIRSVSSLGVKCIYTPDGMKEHHWEEAKKFFELC